MRQVIARNVTLVVSLVVVWQHYIGSLHAPFCNAPFPGAPLHAFEPLSWDVPVPLTQRNARLPVAKSNVYGD
jgi:hypothetical protein